MGKRTVGKRLVICLLAVLTGAACMSGCGGEKERADDVDVKAERQSDAGTGNEDAEKATAEMTVMPVPEPTATPEPTVTPEPTAIPEPTVTPIPTAAPEPTAVPEETAVLSDGTLSAPQEEGMLSKPDHSDAVTNDKLIFIGDSRTEGIRDAVDNPGNVIWSCLSSMGYDWMTSTGVPQIEDSIDEYTAVIILMGVNDVYQINNYVNYINKKANEWADLGARTYFVSVGPVESDPYVTNQQIEVFNSEMEANLAGVTYIDVYSHLVSNGFYTVDGIHYPDSVSREIYNFVLDHLEETRSGIWG